ncbi:MAG TPA: OmpA family protein [Gammaproteobacteria bacterium]|nr:OmpA family protein [Gammaproteobacteria bacterium]
MIMKHLSRSCLVAGLGLACSVGQAATGYVDNSESSIVRTGYGDCVHTQRWSVPNAIAECDPEIVAARDAVEVAAVEVFIRTERNPVHLETDTLFGFDSDRLTDSGKTLLDDMVGNLTAATLLEQKIQITGYADRIGDDTYNLELSKRRAAAVRDYLVSKGVVPSFIEMKGLGESNPVVNCEDKRGAALIDCLAPNRRTEIEFSAMEVIEVKEEVPVKPK